MAATSVSKLDQALKDLVEAFLNLEEELESAHGDDEDSYSGALVEALEGAIEGAMDEFGASSHSIASLVSAMSESLEQLDPSAFGDDEPEFGMGGMDYDVDDEDEDLDLEDDD